MQMRLQITSAYDCVSLCLNSEKASHLID